MSTLQPYYLPFSITLILLFMFSCGVHVTPAKETIYIPKKIFSEIPSLLETSPSDKVQSKIKVDPIEGEATGYKVIKKYIVELESIVNEIKSNIFLGNKVMSSVLEQCKTTAVGEICTITKNTLSFTIDKEALDRFRILIPHIFEYRQIKELEGKELFFGEIEFISYDENATYQYAINMDMTEINGAIGSYSKLNAPKIIQVIKWSKDENRIFSSITTKYPNGIDFPWTLHYKNRPNIEEISRLNDKAIGKDDINIDSTSRLFTLQNRFDINETSTVKLNSIKSIPFISGKLIKQTSSLLQLDKNSGFQKITETQTVGTTVRKSNKEELFSTTGKLVASTYCFNTTPECNLYDSSSWFIDVDDESLFDPLNAFDFRELKVEALNLKEGEYLLLPINVNVLALTAYEVLNLSVGEFVVLQGYSQGILYDVSYREKLNELQVVYAKYNNKLDLQFKEKDDTLFEIIDERQLNLTLWE